MVPLLDNRPPHLIHLVADLSYTPSCAYNFFFGHGKRLHAEFPVTRHLEALEINPELQVLLITSKVLEFYLSLLSAILKLFKIFLEGP